MEKIKQINMKEEINDISIRCLKCKTIFKLKCNGKRLTHTQKDDSITKDNKLIHCPKCNGAKLIFKTYYDF